MLQFPGFPFLPEQLENPWFKVCMQLARVYRSLPRSSSALEPSHPLAGARYANCWLASACCFAAALARTFVLALTLTNN